MKKSEFAERKRYEENSSALIDTVIGAEYSCAGTRRGKNATEEVYNACFAASITAFTGTALTTTSTLILGRSENSTGTPR